MILVTGHPRSGTGYMARLLQAFGVDIGHEKMGRDGISCWAWATFDPSPPWSPAPRPREEVELIHVLRHPIDVAQSSAAINCGQSKLYRSKFVVQFPDWSDIENEVLSVIGWTKLIQAQRPALTVMAEDAAPAIEEYLGRAPVTHLPPRNINNGSDKSGSRYKRRPRPEIFARLRPELQRALQEYCVEWGYRVDVHEAA